MPRRWNGWGDESVSYPLPDSALRFLENQIGTGVRLPDAPFGTLLTGLSKKQLPPHPLITTDGVERARHARGQSLPDWIGLRSGHVSSFPDGVVYPKSEIEIRSILDYAQEFGVKLIPYGGGTSVLGHINPPKEDFPCLTVNLSRLNRLIDLDDTSQLATFEAGVLGPQLEAQLASRGFTLGHFPQSFEFSTLGGWIATRSSGQQSYFYGRIEYLFAGGRVETPVGSLDLAPHPASAAGPDLRQVVLGSEGRLGIITRATLRIRPFPEAEGFYAAFFKTWESGITAVRQIAQEGMPISMLRLSDPLETDTTLALAGKGRFVTWGSQALRLLGFGPERCLLIFGVTGYRRLAGQTRDQVNALCRAHEGLPLGRPIGDIWRKSRFLTPYLRNTLWDQGYALDTLETAVPWKSVMPLAAALKADILSKSAQEGDRLLAFCHLSHVYRDGASLYFTIMFPRQVSHEENLRIWQTFKNTASQTIHSFQGTISHQHGVGRDHAPYIEAEKGATGLKLLRGLCNASDPSGIMNPGVLLEE